MRQKKNLAFSEDTCVEKGRVRSKVTTRRVKEGLKQRRELSMKITLAGIHQKRGLTIAQI